MSDPQFIVATSTWNSADLIDDFLRHCKKLGASAVFVMEYQSTDNTRELLNAKHWRNFVHIFDIPNVIADSSNSLLAEAQVRFPDAWCLFCDPDEFLVTPNMRFSDLLSNKEVSEPELISVPRHNMSAPFSATYNPSGESQPFSTFTLRIDRQKTRSREDFVAETLDPPWIFTAIPGKVLVKLQACLEIGPGDHQATTHNARIQAAPADCCLLHYPIRSYDQFAKKLQLAELQFDTAGDELPEFFGWQYRRWIKQLAANRLYDEYLLQMIPDERIPELIADGTLTFDTRIRDFIR